MYYHRIIVTKMYTIFLITKTSLRISEYFINEGSKKMILI